MTFLSFESMFTENVNLKCNMSTDMYYFTVFVRENRVYLPVVECPRYFASVIYKKKKKKKKKQLRQSLDHTTPNQASWMQIYGVSV